MKYQNRDLEFSEETIVLLFSLDKSEELALEQVFPLVLEKCNINFSRNPSRYYHSLENQGEVYFNPYHSGQWTIFLYYLSHILYTKCLGGY